MTSGSTLLDPPAPARPSLGGGPSGGDRGHGDGGRGDHGDDSEDDRSLPLSNARMLMILALIASTMLFTGLIGAFIVLRTDPSWPRAQFASRLGLNTAVIVASSVALAAAHFAQRRGRLRATRIGLVLATAGAVTFLVLQIRIWHELVLAGIVPSTANRAGLFYLLTSAHFAHAAVGLLFLLIASGKSLRGYSIERLALPVDLAALFWHFVDFAWIVLWLLLR